MDSKHSSSVIFSVTLFSHFNLTGPQSPYLQNKVTLNLHKISLCSRELPWQSVVYDCTSNAGGTGSIHGQGPQIQGTAWHSQKKKIVFIKKFLSSKCSYIHVRKSCRTFKKHLKPRSVNRRFNTNFHQSLRHIRVTHH